MKRLYLSVFVVIFSTSALSVEYVLLAGIADSYEWLFNEKLNYVDGKQDNE